MVTNFKAIRLSDPTALLKGIDATLREVVKGCGDGETSVKLRLMVDASGKVTKVEIMEAGDKKLAGCIREGLEELESATTAIGAAVGTLAVAGNGAKI